MFNTTIDFKLKIGSVIKVNKDHYHNGQLPVGTYIVHLITTSISDPDMVQRDNDEYFLENIDDHFRDYTIGSDDLESPDIEVLDTKVDLYKVKFIELRDAENSSMLEDLVYVLHGTEPTKEYFNKRIEAAYDYYPNALERVKMRDVNTDSWELIKENF